MEIRALTGLHKQAEQTRGKLAGDFAQELRKLVYWVDQQQKRSESIKEAVLKGAEIPLHQMVIELEKASLALNLLIQIRNRLVEAFQELNRLQV